MTKFQTFAQGCRIALCKLTACDVEKKMNLHLLPTPARQRPRREMEPGVNVYIQPLPFYIGKPLQLRSVPIGRSSQEAASSPPLSPSSSDSSLPPLIPVHDPNFSFEHLSLPPTTPTQETSVEVQHRATVHVPFLPWLIGMPVDIDGTPAGQSSVEENSFTALSSRPSCLCAEETEELEPVD